MVNMTKQTVTVQHSFKLSIIEEQTFAEAILKKYGCIHGNVNKAINEAILDWCSKIRK